MRLPRSDWALIAAASVLLTFAYPPFRLVAPAFVCLVPAALLLVRGAADGDAWRRHLHQGFWYGSITHGVLLYWLAGALWHVGRAAVGLYVVAAVMFGGAYAVVFAVAGRAARGSRGRLVLVLPAGVVLLEWLAEQVGPIGFPWHQLALTVTATPVLVQTADIAGAAGSSFLIAAINASVALAWSTRHDRLAALEHLETAGAVLLVMVVYGLHRVTTLPLAPRVEVAVVQPNVAAEEKWVAGGRDAVAERAALLTERALSATRAEFVALPETALPDAIGAHPGWGARLTRLAHTSASTLVVGVVEEAGAGTGPHRRYNAALALEPFGRGTPRTVHRKQKLIPFVEHVPGGRADLSPTGFGGFRPGREWSTATGRVGRYGVLLCYELTFPGMARQLRAAGADVLVTLSNDAWFGRTAAPYQHFAHATLRAVENRVSVVRAANSGVSGIVDPLGRVVARTPTFVETYAAGVVQHSPVVPPAVRFAGLAGPAALGLLLVLCLVSPGAARSSQYARAAKTPTRVPATAPAAV